MQKLNEQVSYTSIRSIRGFTINLQYYCEPYFELEMIKDNQFCVAWVPFFLVPDKGLIEMLKKYEQSEYGSIPEQYHQIKNAIERTKERQTRMLEKNAILIRDSVYELKQENPTSNDQLTKRENVKFSADYENNEKIKRDMIKDEDFMNLKRNFLIRKIGKNKRIAIPIKNGTIPILANFGNGEEKVYIVDDLSSEMKSKQESKDNIIKQHGHVDRTFCNNQPSQIKQEEQSNQQPMSKFSNRNHQYTYVNNDQRMMNRAIPSIDQPLNMKPRFDILQHTYKMFIARFKHKSNYTKPNDQSLLPFFQPNEQYTEKDYEFTVKLQEYINEGSKFDDKLEDEEFYFHYCEIEDSKRLTKLVKKKYNRYIDLFKKYDYFKRILMSKNQKRNQRILLTQEMLPECARAFLILQSINADICENLRVIDGIANVTLKRSRKRVSSLSNAVDIAGVKKRFTNDLKEFMNKWFAYEEWVNSKKNPQMNIRNERERF